MDSDFNPLSMQPETLLSEDEMCIKVHMIGGPCVGADRVDKMIVEVANLENSISIDAMMTAVGALA